MWAAAAATARQTTSTFLCQKQKLCNSGIKKCVSSSHRRGMLTATTMDDDHPVATITMNRPPVNSLNLELFQALSESIQAIEANPNIEALVLASDLTHTFSAGLDLSEMHNFERARLLEFWHAFQQLYLDLYGSSRLVTVAAIAGHAPAAGCMLALSCDYRVMAHYDTDDHAANADNGDTTNKMTLPQPRIGLNETRFGIAAPPWLARQMVDTLGARPAALALTQGKLFEPPQALAVGLVDELVRINNPSDDSSPTPQQQVLARAQQVAREWAQIPALGRTATKQTLRSAALESLRDPKRRQEDTDLFLRMVQDEGTQARLGAYFESLKKKKKQK